MTNDDFLPITRFRKLNEYISKNSKKSVRIVLFLAGLVAGTIVPTLGIDFESIKRGLLIGLIIGFIWAALRYKQLGEEGIMETQSEIFVAFVYLVYFLLGTVGGHYLVKPVLKYFVSRGFPFFPFFH